MFLYSGNPKIKRGGLLKSAKKKSPVNLATYRTLRREREIGYYNEIDHNRL